MTKIERLQMAAYIKFYTLARVLTTITVMWTCTLQFLVKNHHQHTNSLHGWRIF